MKAVQSLNAPFPLIDFGYSSLRMIDGERHIELPVERQGDGRLTARAKEELVPAIQEFIGARWRLRRRVVCAIGARGVLLRNLQLPPSSGKNFGEMLSLQVERELPLPPSELAWGHRHFEPSAAPSGGANLLLAAVRRSIVEEYAAVLSSCRLAPVFTPGILSLLSLCQNPPPSRAVLDIGRRQSELLTSNDGVAENVRVIRFGGDTITAAIASALDIPNDEAERLKIQWSDDGLDDASKAAAIERAVESAFGELARLIAAAWNGERIYLAGKSALLKNAGPLLSNGLGSPVTYEVIERKGAAGASAILEGLKVETADGRHEPSLLLRLPESKRMKASAATPGLRKWGAVAAILLFGFLAFRYIEPLLRKPALERRLAEVTANQTGMPEINHELTFLQHIEDQRSPYLIVMDALGEAMPRGARFESLTMNRRGEVSFQTKLRSSDQAVDLRSKMISSAVFSSVVVEEQRPSPRDRNELIVRITARCKPGAEIIAATR